MERVGTGKGGAVREGREVGSGVERARERGEGRGGECVERGRGMKRESEAEG